MTIRRPVFRAGSYPQGDFTVEAVSQIARDYSPSVHFAPLKVGHGKDSTAQALAWVEGLTAVDGVLFADIGKITPELVDGVNNHRFHKVSIELYNPEQSPTKKFYLRAVGLLGAEPPAVKGLPVFEFSDKETDYFLVESEVDFAEEPEEIQANQDSVEHPEFDDHGGINVKDTHKLVALLLEKGKGKIDDKLVSAFAEETAAAIMNTPGFMSFDEQVATAFVEGIVESKIEAFNEKAKREAAEAAEKDAKQKNAEFAEQARKRTVEAKAEALITAGKLPPKRKDEFVALGMSCPTDDATLVAFMEKDGRQGRRPLFDAFCALFEEFVRPDPALLEEVSKPQNGHLKFTEEEKAGKDIAASLRPKKED